MEPRAEPWVEDIFSPPEPCKGEGNGRVPSPLQGSSLDDLVTQGYACGSTLGYRPTPLRGWNPVQRSHAGFKLAAAVLSPSAESFHIHVVHQPASLPRRALMGYLKDKGQFGPPSR